MVEISTAELGQAKFFLIHIIMFTNDINKSRTKKLVPPDKFDRHMARARQTDITSRKRIFSLQTEETETRQQARSSIKHSTY